MMFIPIRIPNSAAKLYSLNNEEIINTNVGKKRLKP